MSACVDLDSKPWAPATEMEEVAVALAEKVFAERQCFGDKSRPAVEYIGYTSSHLPKKVLANRAIFAARIAFSSLVIRCLLR